VDGAKVCFFQSPSFMLPFPGSSVVFPFDAFPRISYVKRYGGKCEGTVYCFGHLFARLFDNGGKLVLISLPRTGPRTI